MKVIFKERLPLTDTICTFYFEPLEHVSYLAGQFTELRLPHSSPDDRGDKRWFTLSSAPSEQLLSITTKFADETSSSFKKALFSLEPQTPLQLADPMGDFVLPKDAVKPLLFVAGGIGITPMRSMARWLADNNERRDIKLLYAVKDQHEFVFADDFAAAHIPVEHVVSQQNSDWNGEVTTLSADRILQSAQTGTTIYVSGPEPMVESLLEDLKIKGVTEDRLVGDYFPGYPPVN